MRLWRKGGGYPVAAGCCCDTCVQYLLRR
eukprot:SAG25_NODE_2026_length_2014_cov_1.225587_1_plen_28_part_10